jgi:hypothetical protein
MRSRTHAVVAIPDAHGSQQLHDFLLALIRHPRLPGSETFPADLIRREGR